jgi:hypothetical protein
MGHHEPAEARLDAAGSILLSDPRWASDLRSWWLAHDRGANTPNWDLIVTSKIEGVPGLVLVEAKAHEGELCRAGKILRKEASHASVDNHRQIGTAIAEASAALNGAVPGVRLSHDTHYQLANRVAHSWKLASLGMPVILMYLGFLRDAEIGRPLLNHGHWKSLMTAHVTGVLPDGFMDCWIPCGKARMQMVIRSRSATGQRESPGTG